MDNPKIQIKKHPENILPVIDQDILDSMQKRLSEPKSAITAPKDLIAGDEWTAF